MPANRAYGALLRQWREDRHLTQIEVGTKVGVGQQAYGKWELYGVAYNAERFTLLDEVFSLPAGSAESAWLESARAAPDADERSARELLRAVTDRVAALEAQVAALAEASAPTPKVPGRSTRSSPRPEPSRRSTRG